MTFGGLAIASAGRGTPRGNARNVVFYDLSGGISQVDTWDFQENAGTPRDLDVCRVAPGLDLSHRLFPRLASQIGRFTILRSMRSDEEEHFPAQYALQAGRPLDRVVAAEIPALGSVVSMELESQRRGRDTLPTYVSFNLRRAYPGALSSGFLDPRHTGVDIDVADRTPAQMALRQAEARTTVSDRVRYGNHTAGISCALARNLLAADGGTRYVHIRHPGWDHHAGIWSPDNHYRRCAQFDAAFTSLIEDLSTLPSQERPGGTLLNETLVVAMGEFGRTPGKLNCMGGRDHHRMTFPALFAGAGVKAGLILGRSHSASGECLETGWCHREQPRMENVAATIYSALGIDYAKAIRNTPSGRPYHYINSLRRGGSIPTDEIASIYGQ